MTFEGHNLFYEIRIWENQAHVFNSIFLPCYQNPSFPFRWACFFKVKSIDFPKYVLKALLISYECPQKHLFLPLLLFLHNKKKFVPYECIGVVKNSYKNALRDQHQMCHCVRLYSIKQGKKDERLSLTCPWLFMWLKAKMSFGIYEITLQYFSRHKTCEWNENWSFLWFRNSLDMWKSYTRAS